MALHWQPQAMSPEEYKATIVIAGATGVPQQFYQRFSRFAADNGYRTVTFDYRGDWSI